MIHAWLALGPRFPLRPRTVCLNRISCYRIRVVQPLVNCPRGGGSGHFSCSNSSKDRRSTRSFILAVSSFCTQRCFEWNQAPLLVPLRVIIGGASSARLPPESFSQPVWRSLKSQMPHSCSFE